MGDEMMMDFPADRTTIDWKFTIGNKVHSELYNANGAVGLRRYIADKAGGEVQYQVYFRVGSPILIDWVEPAMLVEGHKTYID